MVARQRATAPERSENGDYIMLMMMTMSVAVSSSSAGVILTEPSRNRTFGIRVLLLVAVVKSSSGGTDEGEEEGFSVAGS